MPDKTMTESMEDYLEMFYRLYLSQGYVRPVDLSDAIKVQPSSVTRMIQKLDEAGFLTYEKYRNISLTPLGVAYGRFLVWRDEALKDFLRLLGAQAGIDEQVEGIEHYITPHTMSIIRNLTNFFKASPERLETFMTMRREKAYPDDEDLAFLRAWLFKHGDL